MSQSCDPFRQNHKRIAAQTLLGIYGDLDDYHLFLSIGKVVPWLSAEGSNLDNDPPANIDSVRNETDFWRSVFAHKRIDRSDVSLVVRRFDWTPGVVYTPYRDNVDLFDDLSPAPFYVLVDEERVYKCIDNNYGGRSTVAPTYTDSAIRRLSDGYRWKFLYQIPESKRKFLTRTRGNSIGYMPIERIDYLRVGDERILQWNVQQDAVDGEIAYIQINPEVRPFVVSERCVFPNADNTVVVDVAPGSTGVTLASPFLFPQPNYYNDMILSIDTNAGRGQRRVITEFTPSGVGNTVFVAVDKPFAFGLSGGVGGSKFSIVPHVRVIGDGTSNRNINNPLSTAAEISVRFGATAGVDATGVPTGEDCKKYYETVRLIDSFEIVDGGKQYTFAELDYVKGLIVPTGKANLEDLATPIMSPPGGHGSNPVKELGASSIMIVKEYRGDEGGKISTENDFRQFGLLLDPLLKEKQVRISFFEPGLLGSFAVGATAAQDGTTGVDPAYGSVVSWYAGTSGHSGTNELVLTNIRDGDFVHAATMSGLRIFNVDTRTEAGSEVRKLLRLTLGNICDPFTANDFTRGFLAHAVGDFETTMPPSRALGEVYAWEPRLGTDSFAYLFLENVVGEFKVGERISQTDKLYGGFTGDIVGLGQILAIDTVIREGVDTYDQTTSLVVGYDGTSLFDSSSFRQDDFVTFDDGAIGFANGYVMDWSVLGDGTTGQIRLLGTQGTFELGMNTPYGVNAGNATISSILHTGELQYRSGEILYIQNVKPIQRAQDQKEEIKIVIDF
jgi:hypothetical protein